MNKLYCIAMLKNVKIIQKWIDNNRFFIVIRQIVMKI